MPFTALLWDALQSHVGGEAPASGTLTPREAMQRFAVEGGPTLAELSAQGPQLVVFLRHLGCTFCREALDDLRRQRAEIEAGGAALVVVHLSQESDAAPMLERYDLADVARISDPTGELYRAFGLVRGGVRQLFGWQVWWRGFRAALMAGHGVGRLMGDGLQMPGVFLVQDGEVRQAFRHASAADRPDYRELASCPVEGVASS